MSNEFLTYAHKYMYMYMYWKAHYSIVLDGVNLVLPGPVVICKEMEAQQPMLAFPHVFLHMHIPTNVGEAYPLSKCYSLSIFISPRTNFGGVKFSEAHHFLHELFLL